MRAELSHADMSHQPLLFWLLLLSRVWLFATPWTAAHQASLSITISWNLLKLMSIELVMPSNHLILVFWYLKIKELFPAIIIDAL